MSWSWRYDPEPPADVPAPSAEPFASQSDAETWLGENWRELLHAGVLRVTLFEDAREVYGPMGLEPA